MEGGTWWATSPWGHKKSDTTEHTFIAYTLENSLALCFFGKQFNLYHSWLNWKSLISRSLLATRNTVNQTLYKRGDLLHNLIKNQSTVSCTIGPQEYTQIQGEKTEVNHHLKTYHHDRNFITQIWHDQCNQIIKIHFHCQICILLLKYFENKDFFFLFYSNTFKCMK